MHARLQELCRWAQFSFYPMALLSTNSMRSLLRNKQDTDWSPVSLLAIKPCCAQLHWNYPEYPLGQRLNFANTKRCNRPILPGPWLRARRQAVTPDEVLFFDLVWKQWFMHTGAFPCSHLFCSVPGAAAHEPGFAGEFTFQKIRRCPTSKPCLGLELSFLHLSALLL